MTSTILREFLENGALLVALGVAHPVIARHLANAHPAVRRLGLGLAFGTVAALGMLIPVHAAPGVILDARAMVLGLAGCIGGPLVGLTAGAVAGAMRWHLGGAGALPGVLGCLLSAAVGVAFHRLLGRRAGPPPLLALPFVGFASALAGLLTVFLLPFELAWSLFRTTGPIFLVVQALGALALGWLLTLDHRMRSAERKAQALAERFRDFSESAADWLWEMDGELRFTDLSACFEGVSRAVPPQLIGKRRGELGSWTEPPELMAQNLEDMAARRPFVDFRFYAPSLDGSIAYISSSGKPIFDERGRFLGYRGVARDLTALAKAEARERIARERFRDFAEAAGDWYWELGPDLRFTYVSPTVERASGRAPGFYLGRKRAELFSPEERRGPLAAHLATLERHEAFRDFRYSRVEADGRRHTYAISGKPVFDAAGGFAGYRGVGGDVTEAIEQKARFEAAQQRFLESIDNLDEGLLNFGADGRIVAVNKAMIRMYPDIADILRPGIAYEEIVRTSLDRMVIEVPEGQRERWIAQRLAEWGSDGGECEQQLSNGRWIRFSDRRTGDGGVVSIRVDITDLKSRENLLTERTEQLGATLESIDEGVCMLDSEFRLVAWNELFVELTGMPREALKVGLPCEDLMRIQAQIGLFGDVADPEDFVRRRMETVRRREESGDLLSVKGRTIELRRRPIAGGGCISSLRDVTVEHRREEELTRRASRDALTGLANRTSFEEALDAAFATPERFPIALLFLDLDRFKQINDEIGHEAGDRVLLEVARRLAGCMRADDLPARLGGDEFVVLLTGETARCPEAIVERVQAALAQPIAVGDRKLQVSASIGVARPREGDDRASLLRAADGEMYRAKRAARSGVVVPFAEARLRRSA